MKLPNIAVRFCAEYAFKKISRDKKQSAVLLLVATVFTFAMCYSAGLIRKQKADLDNIKVNTEVMGELCDITGQHTDGLALLTYYEYFYDTDGSLHKFVKDISLKRTFKFSAEDEVAELFDSGENKNKPSLIAITQVDAIDALQPENGSEIVWFDGYDSGVFGGDEYVCLIPENVANGLSVGMGEKKLFIVANEVDNGKTLEIPMSFKVAGYYCGGAQNVYFPWETMRHVLRGIEKDYLAFSDILRFTIADNSLIDEFKDSAYKIFKLPSPATTEPSYYCGLSVYDETYNITLYEAEKALNTTHYSLTVILIAAIAAGFVSAFLCERLRRTERVILYTLGVNRKQLWIMAFYEFLLVFFPGSVFGAVAGFVTSVRWFAAENLISVLFYLILYAVGDILAIGFISSSGTTEILKGRELE